MGWPGAPRRANSTEAAEGQGRKSSGVSVPAASPAASSAIRRPVSQARLSRPLSCAWPETVPPLITPICKSKVGTIPPL